MAYKFQNKISYSNLYYKLNYISSVHLRSFFCVLPNFLRYRSCLNNFELMHLITKYNKKILCENDRIIDTN